MGGLWSEFISYPRCRSQACLYFKSDAMNSGIYKITSPTGRIYIGQSTDIQRRFRDYLKKRSVEKQKRLYNSLQKYGPENHTYEILQLCEIKEMNAIERRYQDLYDATGEMGLNIRTTNDGKRSGTLSQISKDKISIANSGNKNGMYGKKITEHAKKLQREKLSGAKNYLYKPIIHIECGIFYDTLKEAADIIGVDRRNLWAKLVGKVKNNTPFRHA